MSDKIKNIMQTPEVPEDLKPENIPALINKNGKPKNKNSRNIIRCIAAVAACAVIITGTLNIMPALNLKNSVYEEPVPQVTDTAPESSEQLAFKTSGSYESIYEQLAKNKRKETIKDAFNNFFGLNEKEYMFTNDMATGVEDVKTDDEGVMEESSEVSVAVYDTLTQVEGITEADIIKADNNNVFFVKNNVLVHIPFNSASGKFGEATAVETADSLYIKELYLSGNKLVVIADTYNSYAYNSTELLVYNISGSELSLLNQTSQSGYYESSRMKDNIVYVITDQTISFTNNTEKDKPVTYIPCYGDTEKCIPSENIYQPADWDNTEPYIRYVNISATDINEPENSSAVSVAGNSHEIYCSAENLYITETKYNYDDNECSTQTTVTRFSINGTEISPVASGSVNGSVLNQFSMDEYNGYFRIATTGNMYNEDNKYISSNNVYVLDMNMNIIGSVTDFAETETIKSVNFQGNKGYVVTYRNTDPLFSIDFSDPASPEITDALKINGYSAFMRKWSDGLLLGFGTDGTDDGTETGLKLVMFDTTDNENLKECGIYSINSNEEYNMYVYSEALFDRKAIMIDPDKNIIGIPVNKYHYYDEVYHEFSYDIFSYEDGKFIETGSVKTNSKDEGSFKRGLYIGDYLCVFSEYEAISVKLNTMEETDRTDISEFKNNKYWYDWDD